MKFSKERTDCMHCRPSIWLGRDKTEFCSEACYQAFLVAWSLQNGDMSRRDRIVRFHRGGNIDAYNPIYVGSIQKGDVMLLSSKDHPLLVAAMWESSGIYATSYVRYRLYTLQDLQDVLGAGCSRR